MEKIVVSRRVVLEDGIVSAALFITKEGWIKDIVRNPPIDLLPRNKNVLDVGDAVVFPGIVDSHVHVNEPGREEWEGFWTATQAAAAGGVTTIADMPLNSIPPTTTVANLKEKLKSAEGKLHVDVAFWGGVVPNNQVELKSLVDAGVVGFKCFLCPSGVDEFPHVNEEEVRKALKELQGTDSLLAFHAELDNCNSLAGEGDVHVYKTFLDTRPPGMELSAVDLVCRLCTEYGVRCHIVHASSADVVKRVTKEKRENGANLTVETCHHYLSLNAENIPKGGTLYKCCPPIRDAQNQEQLWRFVQNGEIDLIVSDHSPCPLNLKGDGDFISAWGGISSLQFGLSVLWTQAGPRGVSLLTLSRLLSSGPANLCRLNKKGSLTIGKDADLLVFDPDAIWTPTKEDVLHKHKGSPHLDKQLKGRVLLTMLRGEVIYQIGQTPIKRQGRIILRGK